MQLDWAIANLHEPGVLEIVQAVCTPETDRTRSWADMQYGQGIYLYLKSERDDTYVSFMREEDVEPTTALLAAEGVYLNPYSPYNDEFDESVDWG